MNPAEHDPLMPLSDAAEVSAALFIQAANMLQPGTDIRIGGKVVSLD